MGSSPLSDAAHRSSPTRCRNPRARIRVCVQPGALCRAWTVTEEALGIVAFPCCHAAEVSGPRNTGSMSQTLTPESTTHDASFPVTRSASWLSRPAIRPVGCSSV